MNFVPIEHWFHKSNYCWSVGSGEIKNYFLFMLRLSRWIKEKRENRKIVGQRKNFYLHLIEYCLLEHHSIWSKWRLKSWHLLLSISLLVSTLSKWLNLLVYGESRKGRIESFVSCSNDVNKLWLLFKSHLITLNIFDKSSYTFRAHYCLILK